MKKVIAAISVLMLIVMLTVSCATNTKCAAYGDRQRYQIERR